MRTLAVGGETGGPRGVPPGVLLLDRLPLARGVQALGREVPDGPEQPEARTAGHRWRQLHEVPVDEVDEHVDHRDVGPRAADRLDGVQAAVPRNTDIRARRRCWPRPAGRGSSHRRAKAPVPGVDVGAAATDVEQAVQLGEQAGRRERAQPRRRDLQRQREPVEPPDHGREVGGVLGGDGERRVDGSRAVGQQPQRVRARERPEVPLVLGRHGEREDGELLLGRDAQRLARGGEHPQVVGAVHQPGDGGGGAGQVLEVVQDQQDRPLRQHRQQRGRGIHRAEPDLRRDRRGHLGGVLQAGQLHRDDVAATSCHDLLRQPGLPGAAGTGEGHEAVRLQQGQDLGDLAVATDEGVLRRTPCRPHGRGRGQVGVLAQHPLVHRAQRRPGIRPQLVGQGPAGRLVELERLLVATLPRDGPHRELGEALAPRLGGPRPLQRDDDRVEVRRLRRPQDRRGPALERVEPAVRQVPGRSGVERHAGEVGERLAAPQPERPAEGGGGRTVLAGDTQPAPLLGELGEQQQVAGGRGQVQPVARTHGLEQAPGRPGGAVGLERLAPRRHVGLHDVEGARGHVLAPQRVDDLVDADHLAGPQREDGEQGPSPAAGGPGRPAVAGHVQRPEQVDPGGGAIAHGAPPGSCGHPPWHRRQRRSSGVHVAFQCRGPPSVHADQGGRHPTQEEAMTTTSVRDRRPTQGTADPHPVPVPAGRRPLGRGPRTATAVGLAALALVGSGLALRATTGSPADVPGAVRAGGAAAWGGPDVYEPGGRTRPSRTPVGGVVRTSTSRRPHRAPAGHRPVGRARRRRAAAAGTGLGVRRRPRPGPRRSS